MMATANTADILHRLRDGGVTFQEIADRLGSSSRTIYRWSKGETHPVIESLINKVLMEMLDSVAEDQPSALFIPEEGRILRVEP